MATMATHWIKLEVFGDATDVHDAIDRVLDTGALQESIADAGFLVESATVELRTPRGEGTGPSAADDLGLKVAAGEH